MNRGLRAAFTPLFGLFEIKTIVLCLRNKAIGRMTEVERLLRRSLLSPSVKEILMAARDVRATIGELAGSVGASGLIAAYGDGNLQSFENGLMRLYLQDVVATPLEPVMKTFFTSFIDLRNVMLLYKDLRWSVAGACAFISGGSIDRSRFETAFARRDTAALDDLVRGIAAPASVASSEGALETVLLRSMTARLMKMRLGAGIELVVLYVWRIYVQARNLAILHHGADLDPQTLERELIL